MDDMTYVYKQTTGSDLYNEVKLQNDIKNLYNNEIIVRPEKLGPVNRFALYKSQGIILNDIKKAEPSLIAKEFTKIEISNFVRDVQQFIDLYFTENLKKHHMDWFENNYLFDRGIYFAKILVDAFQDYGINHGKWSDRSKFLFEEGINVHLDQIKYEEYDKCIPILDNPNVTKNMKTTNIYQYRKEFEEEDWNHILELHPYFEIMDQTKKSGFPYFQAQNVEYWMDVSNNFYKLITETSSYVIVAYFRTQGGKFEYIGLKRIPRWKVRFVGGTTGVIKLCGAPTTYVYKLSLPETTPYFRDTNDVMDEINVSFSKVYYDEDLAAWTTDITKNDQSHTARLLDPIHEKHCYNILHNGGNSLISSKMAMYTNACYKSMVNPMLVWNVRQAQVSRPNTSRLVKSMSGNPLVPLYQTSSVISAHLSAIGDQLVPDIDKTNLIDTVLKDHTQLLKCQIDDLFFAGTKVDVDVMGKFITNEFGLGINADKVETSEKGYITFLKVDVGHIYDDDKCDELDLLDGTKDKFFTYLGGISTKTKGIFDKERGNRDDGSPLFYVSPDDLDSKEQKELLTTNKAYINGKKVFGVKKVVQQLIGVLLSFSRKMPLQFLAIVEFHFRHKECWKMTLELSKIVDHLVIKEKDFGFNDYVILLKTIARLYT